MKITYVHTAPVPSSAANAVQVARMCAAFTAAGAETRLVQPLGGGDAGEIASEYGLEKKFAASRLPIPPVPGRTLGFGLLASFLYGPGKRGVIYTRAVSVAAAACMLRQPVVLEMHLSAASLRGRLTKRLERVIGSPFFSGMVVISGRLKEDFIKRYPALVGRVLVAHDGADPAVDVLPAELVGDFRVGYVGNLYSGKGMELIAKLVPLCPWACFHIVGGTQEQLEEWRSVLAGHRNIVFHGHVRHADTDAYLEGMDIVLAPYQSVVLGIGGGGQNLADWMSPLKIFEYMSRGKPIVASDLAVLREVLRDGDNALLCPPDEPARWQAALQRLRDDDELRRHIGVRGRDIFLSNYTWKQRARTILGAIGRNVKFSEDEG